MFQYETNSNKKHHKVPERKKPRVEGLGAMAELVLSPSDDEDMGFLKLSNKTDPFTFSS